MASNDSTPVKFDSFVVERAVYKTLLTKKYRNRKKYEEKDPGKVTAFIPGTIVELYVKKGQKIEEGKPLLILEAMKMRNHVTSPVTGKVKSVKVKKGEVVTKEQLLVEIEPA